MRRAWRDVTMVLALALALWGCAAGREDAPAQPGAAQAALFDEEGHVAPVPEAGAPASLADEATLSAEARLDLAALRAAYPGFVLGMEREGSSVLSLVLSGNRRLPYDDGRARTAREALDSPDLRTMMAQKYPLGPMTEALARPAPGFDPGRSRVEPFFALLYGRTRAEVLGSCVRVPFLGRKPLFTTRQGAAQALERVGRRLEALPMDDPAYRRILRPVGGSFVWRVIAGTGRLSMHSFGVAIDLNPSLPYWRNEPHPETMPLRLLSFPKEIVAAFEAEGFIWGGKWASFDLMHFEYRPELILKARALAGEIRLPEPGVTAPPQ